MFACTCCTCCAVGGQVTYRVELSNPGNVFLGNVSFNSTLGLSYNATALADGLDVGETLIMESNITYNTSMIRAMNLSVATNVAAISTIAGVSANSQITITPNRCMSNSTIRKYEMLRNLLRLIVQAYTV